MQKHEELDEDNKTTNVGLPVTLTADFTRLASTSGISGKTFTAQQTSDVDLQMSPTLPLHQASDDLSGEFWIIKLPVTIMYNFRITRFFQAVQLR